MAMLKRQSVSKDLEGMDLLGFGIWFVSLTKRLMAAWRSTTDRKMPRF